MAKLGTGRITLADLTDERPAKMDLATSLEILQSQTGTAYSPDYSLGDGQVIIPSVFFGNEEVAIADKEYYKQIVYNCSDLGDDVDFKWGGAYHNDGTKYESTETINGFAAYKSTYVDNAGCLHICRNLDKTITVEARAENFVDPRTGVVQASISERITLKKISAGTGYQLFIESKDNRWDFEVGGTADIVLSYKVYYDIDEVSSQVVAAKWYKSGEEIDETTLTGKDEIYTVSRNEVFGHETYRLAIKLENGIVLRASVGIDDRTDSFYCELISQGPAYLSPKNNILQVECQIWRDDSQITDNDDFEITYEWYYLNKANNGIDTAQLAENETLGTEKVLEVMYGGDVGTESFMLYCRATIIKGGKKVGYPLGYLSVNCGENFNAVLSQSIISLPCYAEGNIKDSNFSEVIFLTLTGDDGTLLKYNDSTDEFSAPKNDNDFTFSTSTPEEGEDWNCSLTIKANNVSDDWDSKNYSITYQRQGVSYTIPFQIIKTLQGENGTPGFTIDLTNQFHLFAGTDFGANADQSVETGFTAMLADTDISDSLTGLTVNSKDIFKGATVEAANGIYVSSYETTEDEKVIRKIKIRTKASGNNENTYTEPERGTLTFAFKFKNSSTIATERTFLKSFTYGINTTGNSFSLTADPTQIIYSPATSKLNVDKITVSAKYQLGGKGAYITYTNAKVYYEKNGAELSKKYSITLNNGVGTLSSLLTTDTSYTFYYYIENDTLVDIETVPVVTSMDGVEIGGENLLQYSNSLLLVENNGVWTKNSKITYSENLPTIATFSTDGELHSHYIESDYKTFCLSYTAAGSTASDVPSITIQYQTEEGETEKKEILTSIKSKSDFSVNKNIRYYTSFTVSYDLPFKIIFSGSNFTLQQPKLEVGNVATDWTPHYNDSDDEIQELKKLIDGNGDTINGILANLGTSTATTSTGKIKILNGSSASAATKDYEGNWVNKTFSFKIWDENQNKYVDNNITFPDSDALKAYLDKLNEEAIKASNSWTSTLIDESMHSYTSSIEIKTATQEEPEGKINIKTTYYDENNGNVASTNALTLTSNRISFNENNTEVAYISGQKFYITQGQITNSLILGGTETNTHLKITVDDEAQSVAVVWE